MKLCECGCGKPSVIATRKCTRLGHVKGMPVRFVLGHNRKGLGVGKHRNAEGRQLILRPNHSRSNKQGYVYLSIFKAEIAMGKPLPPYALVHHATGDPTVDENLVVCEDIAYHFFLHQRKRAYDACGHASWRKCTFCKEYDDPKNMYLINSIAYRRKCRNAHKRKRYAEKKRRENMCFTGSCSNEYQHGEMNGECKLNNPQPFDCEPDEYDDEIIVDGQRPSMEWVLMATGFIY